VRVHQDQKFFLVLTVCFVAGLLGPARLPGEGVLPAVYRSWVYMPFFAPAQPGAEDLSPEARALMAVKDREIAELKALLANQREASRYLDRLEWRQPVRATPAWIVGVEPDPYRRFFRIHIPSGGAPKKGTAVTVGKTFLGVVDTTTGGDPAIRRVDDTGFKVSVEILAGGEHLQGIATGTHPGSLRIDYVRGTAEVEAGAPIFTTAYDTKIPPGLLIGWVTRVDDENRDGILEIRAQAAALQRHLSQVEILKR
jgi:cell shape-determining protein MreC